jgi:hypothetical protein
MKHRPNCVNSDGWIIDHGSEGYGAAMQSQHRLSALIEVLRLCQMDIV